MTEYVYRVVNRDGVPIGGGYGTNHSHSRQHFYPKESIALMVARQKHNAARRSVDEAPIYRVQRAAVVWEDVPE